MVRWDPETSEKNVKVPRAVLAAISVVVSMKRRFRIDALSVGAVPVAGVFVNDDEKLKSVFSNPVLVSDETGPIS